MKKTKTSLKAGVITMIIVCWLVPILIITALAGILLDRSYRDSAQQEINASAENALRLVQMQLENAISDSKAVSYDGIVRNAYRVYQQNGDSAALYRSVNDYLNQNFSREERYQAVFIRFWGDCAEASAYLLSSGTTGYGLLLQCRENTPEILETMENADTDIRFLMMDQQLYMARNLLDSSFIPYATVVMMLDATILFQPLDAINRIGDLRLSIDECAFRLDAQGSLGEFQDQGTNTDMVYEVEVEDHRVCLTASLTEYDLWAENPWLRWAVLGMALMVMPLLMVAIWQFYRHITRPIQTLVQANLLVQSGQRGYEITQQPPNAEFRILYDHFNSMSTELKNQFERSYLDQQATQQAQIKALQSQINPHFLNNTLEVINWEARLEGNQRVSAMIEALSTMLTASLDRDGRTQIPLKEELSYVDAYLYIIHERLGEGFHVYKQIEEGALEQMIPRLILQPIVENAVEHGITAQRGGNIWIRAFCEKGNMVLEVEHDGTMTEQDAKRIQAILSGTSEDHRVGLKNVSQRLELLYGDRGELSITQPQSRRILARICFPQAENAQK